MPTRTGGHPAPDWSVRHARLLAAAIVPPERRVPWHVTGTGGLDVTIARDDVAVAEVQAVVVAP